MRVVYLDVLFALNFAMDYCILRCVSALSGRPAAVWRLSLAAGLGALYAGGCIVIPVLSTLPVRMTAISAADICSGEFDGLIEP